MLEIVPVEVNTTELPVFVYSTVMSPLNELPATKVHGIVTVALAPAATDVAVVSVPQGGTATLVML